GGAVGYLGTSASEKTAAVANVNAGSGMIVEANTSAHGNEILTLAGGVVGIAEGATVENSSSAAGVVVSGSKTTYSLASYTYADQFANFCGLKPVQLCAVGCG
ncbi:MAG: hypothetical protein LUF77_04735, partial [Oscillospiraceae bacterium]|nr:hypothetical protein [Oscillospiraceae bacterium]